MAGDASKIFWNITTCGLGFRNQESITDLDLGWVYEIQFQISLLWEIHIMEFDGFMFASLEQLCWSRPQMSLAMVANLCRALLSWCHVGVVDVLVNDVRWCGSSLDVIA